RPEAAEDLDARLARAGLLARVGRADDAVREFRRLRRKGDPDFELRLLERWRRVRRAQGRRDAARTVDRWILEEFPGSPAAVGIHFARADALHDAGAYEEAAEEFRRAWRAAPRLSQAGEARMREGQLRLLLDDVEGAADVFEGYLADFPRGRRWAQAAYWAARARLEMADTSRALPLLQRVLAEEPLSYYAVLASDVLGRPYAPALVVPPPAATPAWLAAALDTLDALVDAGLPGGAGVVARSLAVRAGREGNEARLAVAEALLERGRTVEGINLGWAALQDGYRWDERLARIVYPYPYREIVEREAAERGVDSLLLAALIRQESAFSEAIRSPAGAIGLMQVMPATGAQLARAEGVRPFSAASLARAEINVHLGTTFLLDMGERFGTDRASLPLLLSAYNAGPTRARRWRRFAEADDAERFTERIPFSETRGYVKNVSRNLALYRALYGPPASAEDAAAARVREAPRASGEGDRARVSSAVRPAAPGDGGR
ncbi:MAG: hypothetical protein D6701_11570, partial [Gemmatimonadetes bacterium]